MRLLISLTLVLSGTVWVYAFNEVLYLHDSPAPPTGDQSWNDQWSGNVAYPIGEYMDDITPFHSGSPLPWAVVTIPVDNTSHSDPNSAGSHLFCHDEPAHHYEDGDYDAYLWLKKKTAAAPYETIVVSVWDETLSGPLVNLVAGPASVVITDYTNWNEYHFHLPFVQSQLEPRIVLVISMLEWENAELSWDHTAHDSRLETPGCTGLESLTLGAIKAAFR